MRLLLDTPIFLWWVNGDAALPAKIARAISDPVCEVYVSSVTAYEIATKHRLGKLALGALVLAGFAAEIGRNRFLELRLSFDHALMAGSFRVAHRDPWDRLLAAQAAVEGLTLATVDHVFDQFSIALLR